uniref:Uncharacterized protein n=1 Tax=Nelumbo nucifera TaxID=4432 RepID=A0A822YMG5_NELNU|nr:TPA_asm: hypothetical protein HUJ06_012563 [Nelumbo nucifera]
MVLNLLKELQVRAVSGPNPAKERMSESLGCEPRPGGSNGQVSADGSVLWMNRLPFLLGSFYWNINQCLGHPISPGARGGTNVLGGFDLTIVNDLPRSLEDTRTHPDDAEPSGQCVDFAHHQLPPLPSPRWKNSSKGSRLMTRAFGYLFSSGRSRGQASLGSNDVS